MDLFKQRLETILEQLDPDQQEQLLGLFDEIPFEDLIPEEAKYFHDKFIEIQYSSNPTLQGRDIRHVIIYPYKPQTL